MTKKLVMILLLVVICRDGFSQPIQKMDSLHRQLVTANNDVERVNTLIELCAQYRLGNADSSLLYGEQALKLARQINYPRGEILGLSFMGITIMHLGNLPLALEMGFKGLQIAASNNLENITSPTLNLLGEVYLILKDYPKALAYFEKQKKLYETIEINEGFGYVFYDIGNVYEEMGELDSARHNALQALEIFRQIDREEPLVFKTLGNIELKSKNWDKALYYFKQSLQLSIQNNEHRATPYAYNKIAEFYKNTNQLDSAIYYGRKGLEASTMSSQKNPLQEAATLLSELFEQKNDPNESLRYLKMAYAYKDSLFGKNNLQAIQVLVNQQEQHQKEIESSRIRYQNNLRQYALVAGLGILLLVAGILYRNNKHKQKANILLFQEKEKVESTLSELEATQKQLIQSEKMASLGELTAGIAHEIQNPLNFVNNFSEVNTELLTELDEELKNNTESLGVQNLSLLLQDIKDNEQKINYHGRRADSIVKGMLQHSRKGAGIKELTDINALCDEYLRLAYHGYKAKDKTFNADFETHFDPNLPKVDVIVQDFGRVILNIINNAFYALSTSDSKEKTTLSSETLDKGDKLEENTERPKVIITTQYIDQPMTLHAKLIAGPCIQITIADNGPGIPNELKDKVFQPFFTTKPTGSGTGLGLSLAYEIVTSAHQGELVLESTEGQGSKFIIRLPLKPNSL